MTSRASGVQTTHVRVQVFLFVLLCTSLCLCASAVQCFQTQVESVEGGPSESTWTSHSRIEGHLALDYSPAGAFSPDSTLLAIAESDGKAALMDLTTGGIRKVLHPRVEGVSDLDIQSANFLDPSHLLILGRGLFRTKGKSELAPRTPLLALQWDIDQDAISGKTDTVGASGGFDPIVYFPHFRYVGLYKDGTFQLWSPVNGRAMEITIPDLKHRPGLYVFSPDGHWLLLGRVATNASPDPLVVRLSERKFVNSLTGHQGAVLDISFSPDSKFVATACEDGKVRVWSAGDWKLLKTLAGHQGPVHWAEFSPDSQWIASAGEDHTVRIWSVETGALARTLSESSDPLLTVAFSPNGQYLAASSENAVYVWQKR